MVKSACGIEAVYMCFNGTGIWGGETLTLPLADVSCDVSHQHARDRIRRGQLPQSLLLDER